MKIFALHLCLDFQVRDAESENILFPLLPVADFLEGFDPAQAPPGGQYYIRGESSATFQRQLFDLQAREAFRNLSSTLAIVFPSHAEMDRLLREFLLRFKPVAAAGGLVVNEKGEYLCILNRGRWSLPKGRVERKESPEQAALREVEEETGLAPLQLDRKIGETYHTFLQRSDWMLKTTHWFRMRASSGSPLQPQQEENIEAAEWFSKARWLEVAPESYPQTQELFEAEFSRSFLSLNDVSS
jgi:8-oxo-dGTP pyrophosphatase MutT (NUDIX family)